VIEVESCRRGGAVDARRKALPEAIPTVVSRIEPIDRQDCDRARTMFYG